MKAVGAADPQALRLPHRADRQRAARARLFIAACAIFTAATPFAGDDRGPAGRRLLPLAAIHRDQRARLCRGAEPRRMSRATALAARRAAGVARDRRRHRRARGRDDRRRYRRGSRRITAADFPPRVPRWSARSPRAVDDCSSRGCRPMRARKWPTATPHRPRRESSDQRGCATRPRNPVAST